MLGLLQTRSPGKVARMTSFRDQAKEILEYAPGMGWGGQGNLDNALLALEEAHKSEILSKLPKEIDNWKDVDPRKIGERTSSSGNLGLYRSAWNQCLADVKKQLEIG